MGSNIRCLVAHEGDYIMILNCSLEPDAGIVNFYQEKVVSFNFVRYISNFLYSRRIL